MFAGINDGGRLARRACGRRRESDQYWLRSASCTAPAVSMGGSDERFALVPVSGPVWTNSRCSVGNGDQRTRSSCPGRQQRRESRAAGNTMVKGPGQNNSIKREAVGDRSNQGEPISRDPINTRMGLSGGRPLHCDQAA